MESPPAVRAQLYEGYKYIYMLYQRKVLRLILKEKRVSVS